jgi:hypothetical protein
MASGDVTCVYLPTVDASFRADTGFCTPELSDSMHARHDAGRLESFFGATTVKTSDTGVKRKDAEQKGGAAKKAKADQKGAAPKKGKPGGIKALKK